MLCSKSPSVLLQRHDTIPGSSLIIPVKSQVQWLKGGLRIPSSLSGEQEAPC